MLICRSILKHNIITYFLFILGFIVLLLGAKWLIDGASSIGRKFGLPQLLIGMTIVALGTSLPELIINVFASIEGNTELAIGNVIGSNIINSLLIVGVAATIYPISMAGRKSSIDVWFSFAVTLVLLFVANFTYFGSDVHHLVSRYDGVIFLILLGGFLYYSFTKGDAVQAEASSIEFKEIKTSWSVILIIAGAAGLYFGGKWIVSGANTIAAGLGISQSAVGMTIIAAVTSLPELVTSIMAAMKKNTDMAVGNAIGSNIFNILLVLGISALINPIPFDTKMNIEIAILLASTLLILLFIKIDFGKTRKAISKIEGIFLMVAYVIFLVFSFTKL